MKTTLTMYEKLKLLKLTHTHTIAHTYTQSGRRKLYSKKNDLHSTCEADVQINNNDQLLAGRTTHTKVNIGACCVNCQRQDIVQSEE